jgi:hypothetical protein
MEMRPVCDLQKTVRAHFAQDAIHSRERREHAGPGAAGDRDGLPRTRRSHRRRHRDVGMRMLFRNSDHTLLSWSRHVTMSTRIDGGEPVVSHSREEAVLEGIEPRREGPEPW